MPQDLVGELRDAAQRAAGSRGAVCAEATSAFWSVARQLRSALPPLQLPCRSGPVNQRIGYLAARTAGLAENLVKLAAEQGARDEDTWLFLLGGAQCPQTVGPTRTVDLSGLAELQAARVIAESDLDALVDLDGATLLDLPLLLALHPARAIIEPLFDPVSEARAGSQTAAQDARPDLAQMVQLARSAAGRLACDPLWTPESPAALNGLVDRAIRLHQRGEFGAAQEEYGRVLARYPEHPVAAYLLGQLLHQQGRTSEAIFWLQRAVVAAPEFRDAHYTLGQRLADSKRWVEAASAYRHAVELTPRFAAGWSGLGLAVQQDTGADEPTAIECLERAVALEPEGVQWRFNLGAVRQRGGDLAGSRQAYEQVLARSPGHTEALFNLGAVAQDQVDYGAAIASYRSAVRHQPGFSAVYPQLGACLQLTGQIEAWLENFRRYRASCSESLSMATYGLEASMADGDPAGHAEWRDRILSGEFATAEPGEFIRNWEQLFFLLLHVDLDREVLHQWYRRYDAAARAQYGEPVGLSGIRRPGRARIGYLSGDLRDHVMGRMIHDWVSRHDHSRYDITLYSLSAARDAWTARFQALGVPLVELWSLPDDAAASRIRQNDIDLLVDCSGHTRGAQPGILARKPARVVVTHIATPGPVGLRAIDFKLTDPLAESDDAQQFVLERLIPVPGGVFPWRRYPAPDPLHRATLGLAADAFVCGAFVSLMKLSPRCLGLWLRLLQRLPNAVLAFSPAEDSWHPGYLRWLRAHGIGSDRVVFVPCPSTEAGRLTRFRVLDVALDPLPCGNVNGTMEALAMGVPVVTLVGTRHGERLGNALLSRFGVTSTIARDEGEYVGIAARLATDLQWAAQVRQLIAQRLVDSPVWNADAHVRGLETAYDQMIAERGAEGDAR